MSISKNKLSVLFATCVMLTIILNCTQDIETINHMDQVLSDVFWNSIDFLTSVSNYLLFVIFGYVLFNNYSSDKTKVKIYGVITYLLIPYLLWQIIMTVAKVVVLGQDFESINFIDTVFLFKAWPPNGPMYLMYPMILFGLASPVFAKLFNRKNISIISLIGLSFFILLICKNFLFPVDTTINTCLFHLTGIFLGAYIANIKNNKLFKYELSFYICAITGFAYFTHSNYMLTINTVIIICLLLLPINNNFYISEGVSFLMYSIHPVLIAVILPVVQSLFNYAIIKNILGSLVVIVVSLVISMAAIYVIKTINKLLKKDKTIFNLITSNFLK